MSDEANGERSGERATPDRSGDGSEGPRRSSGSGLSGRRWLLREFGGAPVWMILALLALIVAVFLTAALTGR